MTVVAVASLGAVIGVALSGGPSASDAIVCPGAQHGATPDAAAPAVSAAGTPAGALPPQLVAQPVRLQLLPVFRRWAQSCDVSSSLLEATCWWESGWQESVVSSTRAVGVCQIEPSTASFVNTVLVPGGRLDVYSASGNIAMGAAYLHDLLGRAGGNESLAVAGYYQGLVSVEQSGMLPATRTYVKGILAYSAIFAAVG